MNPATPSPAACDTGTWVQKASCGWHQPTTGAAHLGTAAGHGAAGVLLALAVIAVLILVTRAAGRARSGKPAPAKN